MKFVVARACCFALAVYLVLAFEPTASFARMMDASTDRDAVRRGTNSVWVERESDSIAIPAGQLSRTDVSDRHDSIRKTGGSKTLWERLFGPGTGTGNSMLSDFLTTLFEIWRIVAFVLLVGLVAVAVYFVAKSNGFQGFSRRNRKPSETEDLEQQRAKISDLPFELEQPLTGLRAAADRYRNAGDYSKATMYLFSYLLVELDHAHCIRLERGKTNGVYIRESRSQPVLRDYLMQTVQLFELTFFGRHPISRDAFESLWNRLASIEAALTHVRDGKSREAIDAPLSALTEAGA